jgi:hypothetical protein
MSTLTAANLVSAIRQLPRNVRYNYVNPSTRGIIKIVRVDAPEGPIIIKRWNPSKGENEAVAEEESISTEMLWRVANSFRPNQPINLDRMLGGSYNTRSVVEALLAHTPEFYYAYPGRYEIIAERTTVRHGHKHLMWVPDDPHALGVMQQRNTDIIISELPSVDAVYEAILLPEAEDSEIDPEIQRSHALMQASLYVIGKQLNYRTWIAANDRNIIFQGRRISEMDGVIPDLRNERMMQAYPEAVRAALLIDCVWFKNGRLMPAVIEVEHTTGVTSGLTRMKNLKDNFVETPTRYVIVAPDEDRDLVVREANKVQFRELNARYFPYSAVRELYALCQRRRIKGITEEFLDCYMEPVVA